MGPQTRRDTDRPAQRTGRGPSAPPGRHRVRLSRRGRRVRAALILVLVICVAWLGTSVGGALTRPGTDSVAARLAEWGRTHGLGWAVTTLEHGQYALSKPKTGGSVAGGVPTIGSGVHAAAAGPSGPTSHLAKPPAPIRPLAPSHLAREGQWQSLLTVHGHTAARVAYLRPDTVHTSYLVDVVWMDPHLLRFTLFPGYQAPGPPLVAPDKLAGKNLNTVLATFNSGFQMVDANGGYWQNGTTVKPLRTGAASMVLTKNGRLSIRPWPGGKPASNVAAVRQNLTMLIQNGKISPKVAHPGPKTWGKTVGNGAFVWRSAIGVRKDGTVLFVVGPAMDISTLAQVLKRAGAVNAMELDINPDWTNYLTYTHPSPGKAVPHRLDSDTAPSLVRYLQPSSRDFVGVFPR